MKAANKRVESDSLHRRFAPPPLVAHAQRSASKAKESSMDINAAQVQLVAVVRRLANEKRADLDRHKENHADINRPDFLWHYLLQSFATMGRSAGWHGLIGNRDNYRGPRKIRSARS